LTIPLDIVHPEIQRCFLRCFNDGHTKPHLRPTAGEWYKALKVAIADLTECDQITNHYYSKSYGKCYWCDRAAQLGVDIFPGVPRVKIQPTATVPPSQSKIFAADNVPELLKQKEKTITVVGRAFSTIHNIQNNHHQSFSINFDNPTSSSCKDGSFRIVISGQGLDKLAQIQGIKPEELKTWKCQFIKITGILDIYQAKKRCFTQVILEDPAQLELLTEGEAKRLLGQASNEATFKTKPIKAAPNQPPATAKIVQTTNNLLFETENQEISLCRQGRVHARQRKYGAAIQCYNQALLLKPDYGIAYYYRGMAHQRVGDKLKAAKDFLEAKRLGVQLPASDYLN